MELRVRPHDRNLFAIGALLIRGASPLQWLLHVQAMGYVLKAIKLYPVPGSLPDSVWGCFVVPGGKIDKDALGNAELFQRVADNLYIPERSALYPAITQQEISRLFSGSPNIYHAELGMIELTEELRIADLLTKPEMRSLIITRPADSVRVPMQVKSFQIKALPPEEMMQQMEADVFPKKDTIKSKPLNVWEQLKLRVYKSLFKKTNGRSERSADGSREHSKLETFFAKVFKMDHSVFNKMQDDYEDLEERNKNELQKLFDMLRSNPAEALKYAIPLDNNGSSRGGMRGRLLLSKMWSDISLFGNFFGASRGDGGAIDLGDDFHKLQQEYNATAIALIQQKEYQKAAFVYLKLLKDHHKAAQTLEMGEYYQEAASIYIKYADNKRQAAICYHKGKMNNEAIELYKELGEDEIVGDLYIEIHQRKEANIYFGRSADKHIALGKYTKAAELYQHKMNDLPAAQSLLLSGWRKKIESTSCLKKYFDNIDNAGQLNEELNKIYLHDINEHNRGQFLQVIRHEYEKNNACADMVKEMAYEIIAAESISNRAIVAELKAFNVDDTQLLKDTMRFKADVKNKKPI